MGSEAKKEPAEKTANFGKLLNEIEASGKDVRQVTEKIRLTVKTLCGRQSQRVKDASEAAQVMRDLKSAGWQRVRYREKDGIVEAEGVLVYPLKQSGVGYCLTKKRLLEEEDEGHSHHYMRLCFGKMEGEWQFYALDYWDRDYEPYGEESGSSLTIDSVKKDHLSYIMEDIPAFLEEYAIYLKEKRKDMEAQHEKNQEIARTIIANFKTD